MKEEIIRKGIRLIDEIRRKENEIKELELDLFNTRELENEPPEELSVCCSSSRQEFNYGGKEFL